MKRNFAAAVELVRTAVEKDRVPGAALLIARGGEVAVREAFGFASLRPDPIAATCETVYDLASLTKVCATTAAIALLVQEGRVGVDDLASKFLPEFADAGGDRAMVTVRHLLTHCAGFPAGGAYAGKRVTIDGVVADIARSRRVSPPGAAFLYSDFSFLTLGAIVERVAKTPLDFFCTDRIFAPLGMRDTGFRPGAYLAPRCASTAAENDTRENRGRVHDPTAFALGGVAGHAGLFSTIDDLFTLSQVWLNGGVANGVRLLSPQTVAQFTAKQSPFPGGERGFGWDRSSAYSVRGELSPESFGHTGFTGTSLWLDPKDRIAIILLTNAVHAKPGIKAITPLRRALSTAVTRSR